MNPSPAAAIIPAPGCWGRVNGGLVGQRARPGQCRRTAPIHQAAPAIYRFGFGGSLIPICLLGAVLLISGGLTWYFLMRSPREDKHVVAHGGGDPGSGTKTIPQNPDGATKQAEEARKLAEITAEQRARKAEEERQLADAQKLEAEQEAKRKAAEEAAKKAAITPPTVDVERVDPAEPVAGQKLTVYLRGTTPDQRPLRYQYRLDPRGPWQPAAASSIELPAVQPGTLTLQIQAVDSRDLASATVQPHLDGRQLHARKAVLHSRPGGPDPVEGIAAGNHQ